MIALRPLLAIIVALVSTATIAQSALAVVPIFSDPCSTPSVPALVPPPPPVYPQWPAMVDATTLDDGGWTGHDNAIALGDDGILRVAYKRFTADPAGASVAAAELVVARSADAGQTWTQTVVDSAISDVVNFETPDLSIESSGATVYVAYAHVWSTRTGDSELRVAKSTDGGASWTITALQSGTGRVADISLVDADRVVLVTSLAIVGQTLSALVPAMAHSADGGATWTIEAVATPIESGISSAAVVSTPDGRSYAPYYNPSSGTEGSASLNVVHGEPGAWSRSIATSACSYTGIDPDAVIESDDTVRAAFFNWSDSRAIYLATSSDDAQSWSVAPIERERAWREGAVSVTVYPFFPVSVAASDGTLAAAYALTTVRSADRLGVTDETEVVSRLAFSPDGGDAWRYASVPHDAPRGGAQDLALAPNGDAFLSLELGEGSTARLDVLRIRLHES